MTGAEPFLSSSEGLEHYLRECEDEGIDNLFFGPESFVAMQEKGLLIPGASCVRVDRSPTPDMLYVVNKEYLLESAGMQQYNPHAVAAPKGVYTPEQALADHEWSISGLNLPFGE